MTYRSSKSVTGAGSARVEKKQKMGKIKRYTKKPTCDMLRVLPDHPRCRRATTVKAVTTWHPSLASVD